MLRYVILVEVRPIRSAQNELMDDVMLVRVDGEGADRDVIGVCHIDSLLYQTNDGKHTDTTAYKRLRNGEAVQFELREISPFLVEKPHVTR